jgi:hypothetical protein
MHARADTTHNATHAHNLVHALTKHKNLKILTDLVLVHSSTLTKIHNQFSTARAPEVQIQPLGVFLAIGQIRWALALRVSAARVGDLPALSADLMALVEQPEL